MAQVLEYLPFQIFRVQLKRFMAVFPGFYPVNGGNIGGFCLQGIAQFAYAGAVTAGTAFNDFMEGAFTAFAHAETASATGFASDAVNLFQHKQMRHTLSTPFAVAPLLLLNFALDLVR